MSPPAQGFCSRDTAHQVNIVVSVLVLEDRVVVNIGYVGSIIVQCVENRKLTLL